MAYLKNGLPIIKRSRSIFERTLIFSLLTLLLSLILVVANSYAPNDWLFVAIQFLFLAFLALSVLTSILGIRHIWRTHPEMRRPIIFLTILTLGIFLLHMYTINLPPTSDCYDKSKKVFGCIMDEVYYVPAAQTLLAGNQCQPYADACNLEHPFLAKALIAVGIELFQPTDFGWRILPTVLGVLCIPLLFSITYLISRNLRLANYAALLLASETLFFVHSGAALIDVPTTFFAMLGFFLYSCGRSLWRLDSLVLSGVAMGLAGLSKETAVFLLAALLTYHTAFFRGSVREWVYSLYKVVAPAGITFVSALQIYDSLYAKNSLPTFLNQVQFMINYGAQLTGSGWTDSLLGTPITPLNWLTYYTPVSYLVTHITVSSAQSSTVFVGVGYYGITNMLTVWMAFLWVPLVFFRWALGRRGGSSPKEPEGDVRASALALIWFLWTYLPYLLLWIYGRVTYPFYFLPAVPALVLGTAFALSRDWFPRRMAVIFIIAAFVWFFWFFPNKGFLPEWIRALIGR